MARSTAICRFTASRVIRPVIGSWPNGAPGQRGSGDCRIRDHREHLLDEGIVAEVIRETLRRITARRRRHLADHDHLEDLHRSGPHPQDAPRPGPVMTTHLDRMGGGSAA